MTDKVNGGVSGGEFLTGSMDFFTIATLVPCFPTNVTTPLADLYTQQGYSTWQSVTVIDGTNTSQTYASASSYQDAFNKQFNLNMLTQLFAQNINPVAVSVSTSTGTAPNAIGLANFGNNFSYSANFGSGYSSTASVVYTLKFITEKTGYWLVSGSTPASTSFNTNSTGYQFLDALESASTAGVLIYDLASNVLNSSTSAGTVTSLSGQSVTLYTNTFEVASSTARNTVAYVSTLLSNYHAGTNQF